MQVGGIHEPKSAAPGANLFLHADDLAQVKALTRIVRTPGQAFQLTPQQANAPDADKRKRRAQHHVGRLAHTAGEGRRPVDCSGHRNRPVHQPLGCQGTPHEPRPL